MISDSLVRPYWDEIISNSPKENVIDSNTIYLGLEEMTFEDFKEEIRLQIKEMISF